MHIKFQIGWVIDVIRVEFPPAANINHSFDTVSARDAGGELLSADALHTLKMERTAARNAVLIYVSPSDRKLAVLGDKGINDVVPDGFWKDVCGLLSSRFASGQFVGGLCEAVSLIGSKLKAYFPYADDDVNELPDEVTFGDISGDDSGEGSL